MWKQIIWRLKRKAISATPHDLRRLLSIYIEFWKSQKCTFSTQVLLPSLVVFRFVARRFRTNHRSPFARLLLPARRLSSFARFCRARTGSPLCDESARINCWSGRHPTKLLFSSKVVAGLTSLASSVGAAWTVVDQKIFFGVLASFARRKLVVANESIPRFQ